MDLPWSAMWSAILDFTRNGLVEGAILLVLAGVCGFLWKRWRYRDGQRIHQFHRESKSQFRSYRGDAAHTKLTRSRVEEVCQHHGKFRRNQKEKESWCLVDDGA